MELGDSLGDLLDDSQFLLDDLSLISSPDDYEGGAYLGNFEALLSGYPYDSVNGSLNTSKVDSLYSGSPFSTSCDSLDVSGPSSSATSPLQPHCSTFDAVDVRFETITSDLNSPVSFHVVHSDNDLEEFGIFDSLTETCHSPHDVVNLASPHTNSHSLEDLQCWTGPTIISSSGPILPIPLQLGEETDLGQSGTPDCFGDGVHLTEIESSDLLDHHQPLLSQPLNIVQPQHQQQATSPTPLPFSRSARKFNGSATTNVTSPPPKSSVRNVRRKGGVGGGRGKNCTNVSQQSSTTPIKLKCPYPNCDKVCVKASHLKAHERRHTGEKPFVCQWSECPWKFWRSDELGRHMRSHTGVKPYQCAICQKRFARSDHLSKHRKVHERSRSGCDFACLPSLHHAHFNPNGENSGGGSDSSPLNQQIVLPKPPKRGRPRNHPNQQNNGHHNYPPSHSFQFIQPFQRVHA